MTDAYNYILLSDVESNDDSNDVLLEWDVANVTNSDNIFGGSGEVEHTLDIGTTTQ